jgi:hypothetical protein
VCVRVCVCVCVCVWHARTRFYGVRFLNNLKGCFWVLERALSLSLSLSLSLRISAKAQTRWRLSLSLSISRSLSLPISLSNIQTRAQTRKSQHAPQLGFFPLTLTVSPPFSTRLSLSLRHTPTHTSLLRVLSNHTNSRFYVRLWVRSTTCIQYTTYTHTCAHSLTPHAQTHTHTHISHAHSPHISPTLLSTRARTLSLSLTHTHTHAHTHHTFLLPFSLAHVQMTSSRLTQIDTCAHTLTQTHVAHISPSLISLTHTTPLPSLSHMKLKRNRSAI